jgi:hypothetical protein
MEEALQPVDRDRAEVAAVEGAGMGREEPDLGGADVESADGGMGEREALWIERPGGARRQAAAVEDDAVGGELEAVAGGGEDELAEGLAAAGTRPALEVAASAGEGGGGPSGRP